MSTSSPPPHVDCEGHHPSLAVPDVEAAESYNVDRLGFERGFTWGDPPTMAGVNLGNVQIFLRKSSPSPDGCGISFVVGDADELFAFHSAEAVDVVEPVGDREWGLRDYTVRDLNGYRLTFGHYIYDVGPPIEIERVDVPLRLERRLAALLADLAEHKRMSIASCLEETLLHTFEPVGEGVASPHTPRTLRYIQELKQKHGIEYDSHGSYRFVERIDPG